MKKIILGLLILCYCNNSFSQRDTCSKDFIYLFNDDILCGDNLLVKSKIIGKNQIFLDSIEYDLGNVKFYKYSNGFYASTKHIIWMASDNSFAKRTENGKLNIYSQSVASGGGMYGGTSTKTMTFYNRDFDNLKEASYDNLLIDLSDNNQAMKVLKRYKSNTVMFVGGTAGICILGAGLISWASRDPNWGGNPPPALIAGGLVLSGSILINFAVKSEKLTKSIRVYNSSL